MNDVPRLIAVDGAAGSGKSTLSRALARALRLAYINTGLMYRALAAAALRHDIDPHDPEGLLELLRDLRFILVEGDPPELAVEGYVSADLTSPDVESTVSTAAAHPDVRARMRAVQRELGEAGAVMEGRDIATVVFPDAPLKLFLRAGEGKRAARRATERGGEATQVTDALRDRDRRDARTNPLEPASGAVVIDTGRLDIDETLAVALEAALRVWPEQPG